jgi:HD superfamily phosphohydrolase
MGDKRIYLDPIHGGIVLNRAKAEERLLMDLIDTPEFQRLRHIKQLGLAFLTFHGAEGSRFTHSLGVLQITRQLLNYLQETCPRVATHRTAALCAALLHDIGHGPFSHATEDIIGYNHEDWTVRILTEDTEINYHLAKFQKNLPEQISQIIKHEYQPNYIGYLISSQLDCDRFDYLLRDSYLTGTEYGRFDLQRVLISLEVDEEHDQILVSDEKGKNPVEDYLFARYSMFIQVYHHRKNWAAKTHLERILRRAKERGNNLCYCDSTVRKWLMGETLSAQEYLELDDSTLLYHIKQWIKDPDDILSDLSRRFLGRKLFKAEQIPADLGLEKSERLYSEARDFIKRSGFNTEYYLASVKSVDRPYDYYRPEENKPCTSIVIKTRTGQRLEISAISDLVSALVKGKFVKEWLIFPPEIALDMARIITPYHT